MKLNRKVASVLLAVTMFAGVLSVPAMAEGETENTASVTFNKYLVMSDDAQVPNATFSYSIKAGNAVDATATTPQVLAGVGVNDITIEDSVFTPNSTTSTNASGAVTLTEGQKYATDEVTVDMSGVTFTAPGVYRYVITENASGVAGVTDAANSIYMDVYVVWDETAEALRVDGYVLHKSDAVAYSTSGSYTDSTEKTTGFVNTYATSSLSLKKEVSGNLADHNEYFEFTVKVSGDKDNKYNVDLTKAESNVTVNGETKVNATELTVDATGSATATYYLKADQEIKITGISGTTQTYEIVENVNASEGYTVSIAGADDNTANPKATGTVNGDSVVYTNTKTAVTPTGLLMDVAPYAAMILLAAAAAFVFLRRRNSNED